MVNHLYEKWLVLEGTKKNLVICIPPTLLPFMAFLCCRKEFDFSLGGNFFCTEERFGIFLFFMQDFISKINMTFYFLKIGYIT